LTPGNTKLNLHSSNHEKYRKDGMVNVKDMKNIQIRLKDFKLSGIVKTLEARNRHAIDNNLAHIDFLKNSSQKTKPNFLIQ